MGESYLGVIQALGFNFAPLHWSYCNGALVAITQNTALFSLLGTTYGGDGRNTFGLPDLRGRAPMGQFQGPGLTNRVIGQRLGAEEITLTEAQMPIHTHAHSYDGSATPATVTLSVAAQPGTRQTPEAGDMLGAAADSFGALSDRLYVPASEVTNTVQLGGVSGGSNFDSSKLKIESTGGGMPVPIMQPSLVVNFCICVHGAFPQRS